MTRLIIAAISAVALLAAVTSIPRSHPVPTVGIAGTGSTSMSQAMQGARTDKLPVDDFEDRSLVFPRETRH